MKRLCRRSYMSGWPSGLRRQTQAIACAVSACRVFWSPSGGVGSNPTSDKVFFYISSPRSSKSAPFEQLLTGSERKEHDFWICEINFFLTLETKEYYFQMNDAVRENKRRKTKELFFTKNSSVYHSRELESYLKIDLQMMKTIKARFNINFSRENSTKSLAKP